MLWRGREPQRRSAAMVKGFGRRPVARRRRHARLRPAFESLQRRKPRSGSGLFDAPDDARSKARMRALDALNARYGRGTVTIGTAGQRHGWALRREFSSPRYTTEWGELLAA
jgi:hypothetical protein